VEIEHENATVCTRTPRGLPRSARKCRVLALERSVRSGTPC
jgi:hypothetical protein